MPLLFRRQHLACPPRVGSRLRMAHIHRPVWRKRHILEHRPVKPRLTISLPEHGMPDSLIVLPLPVMVIPKIARLVSTGSHEFEELLVCDHVTVDLKSGDMHCVGLEFIVPTEQART